MPGLRVARGSGCDGPSSQMFSAPWISSPEPSTPSPAGASRPPSHPALEPDPARFEAAWAEFTERMAANYPFHHPRYAGQMLKPPHPVAIAAYTAALHVNANNHALDGGPATSAMEVEVVALAGGDVRAARRTRSAT